MSDETSLPSRRTLLAGMALLATLRALPARAESRPYMNNVVLLGDSIFDNKAYVGDGPDVVEQLGEALPSGWKATLNAVDGSTTVDVKDQLKRLPSDATHLIVSVGGNDALGHKELIEEDARSVAEVLDKLARLRGEFQQNYRTMLDAVLRKKLPVAVCTIYEARYQDPGTRKIAATGLTIFNDIITREAFARGVPLIDLRLIFDDDADYANDIEPSVQGGAKMAKTITTLVTTHDFARRRSEIYVS
jgi:lysophospholipase L1-like esterase